MSSLCRVWLLLVSLLVGCSSEQAPKDPETAPTDPVEYAPAAPAIDLGSVIRTAHFAFRASPEGWSAAHATHEALVAGAELTLTPHGASVQAPDRGAPIVLRTESVGRGSRALDPSVASTRVAIDGALEIERTGIVETLRNTEHGVEQSWQFAERPEGSGDLVIRVNASGQTYRGTTEGGLHFVDPGTGIGFRYGLGTWIDASGRRTALTPTFESGSIALRVPADVVERSAYPAVLDPVIGPEFGMDNPLYVPAVNDQTQASVSFGGGQYLVVWNDGRFNGSEIYGARVTTGGTVLDPGGILISALSYTRKAPKVAWDGTRWYVVWSEIRGLANDIYGAHVAADGSTPDNGGLSIYSVNDTNAAPAGVAFDGTNFMVAWVFDGGSLGGGILALPVTTAGTPIGSPITVASHPSYVRDVAIAWNGTYFGMAWGTSQGMFARRMAPTGTFPDAAPVLIDTGTIDYNNSNNIQELGETTAASDGTDFFFFWRQRDAVNVYLKYRRVSGATGAPLGSISWVDGALYQASPLTDAGAPSVVFTGAGYLLGWSRSAGGSIDACVGTVTTAGTHTATTSISTGALNWTTALGFDGTNALLVWGKGSGAFTDLHGARLTLAHASLDGAGFLIGGTANLQTNPDVAWSGQNLLVVWEDTRGADKDIFGARISKTGSLLDATGIAIAQATGDQTLPAVAAIGDDFFVVWQDARTDAGDVYGTLVNEAGQVGSPASVVLSAKANAQSAPDIAAVGAEYFAVWSDAGDIYGTRINAAGAVQSVNGILVCNHSNLQLTPAIASNGTDAFVAWADYRSGGAPDIYGGRISSGAPADGLSGVPVSTTADQEAAPAVASNGSGFLVTWQSTPGVVPIPGNIRAARVTSTSGVSDVAGIDIAMGSNTSPATSWDGAYYWLVWGGFDGSVAGTRLDASDGGLVDVPSLLLSAYPDEAALTPTPAIAPFGPQQSLLVYERADLSWVFGGARVKARRIVEPGPIGSPCALDGDCALGTCVDGVCCSTVCDGTCQACTAAKKGGGTDGTCGDIADNTDPDTECPADAFTCTTAVCTSGVCMQAQDANACFIDGACRADGAMHPSSNCLECDVATSRYAWTNTADGSACGGDGIACTTDACTAGVCTHVLNASSCLIAGACYANGTANPSNNCETCDTAASTTAWTTKADGAACTSDGRSCTGDVCAAGACTHPLLAGYCFISNTCYAEAANNPSSSCQHCETATSTTTWTVKADGAACAPDTRTCTSDACESGSCMHPLMAGNCLISGLCRSDGEINPSNSCQYCSPADAIAAWTPVPSCSGTGGAPATGGSPGTGGAGGTTSGGAGPTDGGPDGAVDAGGAPGSGGTTPVDGGGAAGTGGAVSSSGGIGAGGAPPAGSTGGSGPDTTGYGGTPNTGGTRPTESEDASAPGGAPNAGDAGDEPPQAFGSDDGGCGCRLPRSGRNGYGVALALAFVTLAAARRRNAHAARRWRDGARSPLSRY